MKVKQLNYLFLILLFLFSQSAFSQDGSQAPPATLLSPNNTIWVHLYYLQPDSYQPEIAAKTITPEITDRIKAQDIAIKIKQILDAKGLLVDIESIPTSAMYFDSVRNDYIYTPFPDAIPSLYLEKLGNKWYYSKESTSQILSIHSSLFMFGTDWLVNIIPSWGQNRFLGLALWQWIGLVLLITILGILHLLLSRILLPVVNRLSQSKLYPSLIDVKLTRKIARLISYLLLFQLAKVLLPNLMLPINWSQFFVSGIKIASALLVMLALLRVIDIIMAYSRNLAASTTSRLDEQLIPIVKRLLQVVVVIGVLIRILSLLEFNVAALIAGVSIGGIALALAAQDTVKNLIGSAMIFFDRPFQIGDWVEGSGFAGTILEVGFRTTRLQKIDSSIISVPNGTISNIAVTNLGARIYRLMDIKIGIEYGTPPDRIQLFLEGLRGLLLTHPYAINEGYHVYLSGMGDSSLNIMFRAQLGVPDYATDLKAKEEIYFGILRLGEALDVNFAFPSQSLYIQHGDSENKTIGQDELENFLAKFKQGLNN